MSEELNQNEESFNAMQSTKSMGEITNISDVMGEIDKLVRQYSERRLEEISEGKDSADVENEETEFRAQEKPEELTTDCSLFPVNLSQEKESGACAHYRGNSFGLVPLQFGAAFGKAELQDSPHYQKEDYVKILEESMELLKQNNKALLDSLSDKTEAMKALQSRIESLEVDNDKLQKTIQRLEQDNNELHSQVNAISSKEAEQIWIPTEQYEKLGEEYCRLTDKYEELVVRFQELSVELRRKERENQRQSLNMIGKTLNSKKPEKYHKFITNDSEPEPFLTSKEQFSQILKDAAFMQAPSPSKEGAFTVRETNTPSRGADFSNRNLRRMKHQAQKVNTCFLMEIQKELKYQSNDHIYV